MDESEAHSTLPSGTVTFLFTDIEGSTKLLERIREDFRAVISEHNALFRAAFAKWNGREIQFLGDGFHAAFRRATDAVACVAELQRELAEHVWPANATVRVRMGLNTGEAEVDSDHYVASACTVRRGLPPPGTAGRCCSRRRRVTWSTWIYPPA